MQRVRGVAAWNVIILRGNILSGGNGGGSNFVAFSLLGHSLYFIARDGCSRWW